MSSSIEFVPATEAVSTPLPTMELFGKTICYSFEYLDELNDCLDNKHFIIDVVVRPGMLNNQKCFNCTYRGKTRTGDWGIFTFGARSKALHSDPEVDQWAKKGERTLFMNFAQSSDKDYDAKLRSGVWDNVREWYRFKRHVDAAMQKVGKENGVRVTPKHEDRIRFTAKDTIYQTVENGETTIVNSTNPMLEITAKEGRLRVQPKSFCLTFSKTVDGFLGGLKCQLYRSNYLTEDQKENERRLKHNATVLENRKRKIETDGLATIKPEDVSISKHVKVFKGVPVASEDGKLVELLDDSDVAAVAAPVEAVKLVELLEE